ncbi:MAG: class C sortase, partial [Atopobiaceae bacterium]|nr:class C sortase [Atopobiaceae bacterium]
CTPYGVNTHRLLVRGHRIQNAPEEAIVYAEAVRVDARYVALAIAVPVLVVMFLVAVLRPVSSRHSAKTKR